MTDQGRGVVATDEALAVLASPSIAYVGIDGRLIALGEANGKDLRICYVEGQSRIVTITVVNRRAASWESGTTGTPTPRTYG